MFCFYLLLFLSVILAFVPSKKVRVHMAWLPFLIMLLLCGLRAKTVGSDTESYLSHYQFGYGDRMEPLYTATIEFCHFLGVTPHQFIFITALLIYIPLFIVVRKHSANPCFSALIFLAYSVTFFDNTFNGVRQAIALSFVLISLYNLNKKKIIKSFVFFVIASLFHYSSLALLPFLIFFYFVRSMSRAIVVVALIASFLFGISFGQTDFFLQYFDVISLVGEGDVIKNYSQYASDYNVSSLNFMGLLDTMLPLTMYSIFLYDNKNSKDELYKLFVIGAILTNVFVSVRFMYRFVAYFIMPLLFVLPETQNRVKGWRLYGLGFLNFIMILRYLYELLIAGPGMANGIFPYSTCL